MPMPAITACLMVSVLRISIAMWMSPMCAPKPSSIEFQVSEPFSRTTKGSRISVAMRDALLADQRMVRRGDDHVGMRRERLADRCRDPPAAAP